MAPPDVRPALTRLGALAAHPAAFAIVVVYGGLWFVFERSTFDWHGVATLATWMMTLFITRTTYRDTQALHGKLDELIRVEEEARSELTKLDEKEPEEVERHRDAARKQD